jgi:hypothetical protein
VIYKGVVSAFIALSSGAAKVSTFSGTPVPWEGSLHDCELHFELRGAIQAHQGCKFAACSLQHVEAAVLAQAVCLCVDEAAEL